MGGFHDPRHEGNPPGFTVSCIEIELDTETGKYEILDLINVADSGTIMHPKGMENQLVGGAVWGIGLSGYERHLYDPQNECQRALVIGRARFPHFLTPQ